jgi:hypothetical protein
MNSFNLELEATPMIVDNVAVPHIYAIAQNVFKAIKPDHTDATMGETLRLVIPAEGRTNLYVAYLAGPVPFPVGAMLRCGTDGEFRMIVGSRAEIEERVASAGDDPDVMITKLL